MTAVTRRKMVLADDDPATRELAVMSLMRHGFDVVATADGAAALEAVAAHGPCLVVLDVHMPGMGGVEAAREITRSHAGVLVVLWSARPESVDPEVAGSGIARLYSKQDVPVHRLGPLLIELCGKAQG